MSKGLDQTNSTKVPELSPRLRLQFDSWGRSTATEGIQFGYDVVGEPSRWRDPSHHKPIVVLGLVCHGRSQFH